MEKFYSSGKLLLTGEYVVLDGAVALALPTRFGQTLEVSPLDENIIDWKSYGYSGKIWLQAEFDWKEKNLVLKSNLIGNKKTAMDLELILNEARNLSPEFFIDSGYHLTTKLEFPRNWGLGSSSTLIYNLAQWLKTDPYTLLEKTFGGSGYDIAAAGANKPFTYEFNGNERNISKAEFDPSFKDKLFFVHLNEKQNSRESINHYRSLSSKNVKGAVETISALTEGFMNCSNIHDFEVLVNIHETTISELINIPKIKDRLFPDYTGVVKSLGGWGGDFVLATGDNSCKEYFQKKGYSTIVPYTEMVK